MISSVFFYKICLDKFFLRYKFLKKIQKIKRSPCLSYKLKHHLLNLNFNKELYQFLYLNLSFCEKFKFTKQFRLFFLLKLVKFKFLTKLFCNTSYTINTVDFVLVDFANLLHYLKVFFKKFSKFFVLKHILTFYSKQSLLNQHSNSFFLNSFVSNTYLFQNNLINFNNFNIFSNILRQKKKLKNFSVKDFLQFSFKNLFFNIFRVKLSFYTRYRKLRFCFNLSTKRKRYHSPFFKMPVRPRFKRRLKKKKRLVKFYHFRRRRKFIRRRRKFIFFKNILKKKSRFFSIRFCNSFTKHFKVYNFQRSYLKLFFVKKKKLFSFRDYKNTKKILKDLSPSNNDTDYSDPIPEITRINRIFKRRKKRSERYKILYITPLKIRYKIPSNKHYKARYRTHFIQNLYKANKENIKFIGLVGSHFLKQKRSFSNKKRLRRFRRVLRCIMFRLDRFYGDTWYFKRYRISKLCERLNKLKQTVFNRLRAIPKQNKKLFTEYFLKKFSYKSQIFFKRFKIDSCVKNKSIFKKFHFIRCKKLKQIRHFLTSFQLFARGIEILNNNKINMLIRVGPKKTPRINRLTSYNKLLKRTSFFFKKNLTCKNIRERKIRIFRINLQIFIKDFNSFNLTKQKLRKKLKSKFRYIFSVCHKFKYKFNKLYKFLVLPHSLNWFLKQQYLLISRSRFFYFLNLRKFLQLKYTKNLKRFSFSSNFFKKQLFFKKVLTRSAIIKQTYLSQIKSFFKRSKFYSLKKIRMLFLRKCRLLVKTKNLKRLSLVKTKLIYNPKFKVFPLLKQVELNFKTLSFIYLGFTHFKTTNNKIFFSLSLRKIFNRLTF
jgi:hypothetical protein